MIFEFKNLGSIKEAQIEMGNLTVICGKNNTGKTYLTYAVWGFMNDKNGFSYEIPDFPSINYEHIFETLKLDRKAFIDLKELEKDLPKVFKSINKTIDAKIHNIFNTNKSFFKKTIIKLLPSKKIDYKITYKRRFPDNYLTFTKDANSNFLQAKVGNENEVEFYDFTLIKTYINLCLEHFFLSRHLKKFLLSAQRDTIQLFYKELDRNRYEFVKKLQKSKENNFDMDNYVARFPQPIEENINFARDLTSQVIKTNSFLQDEHPELLKEIETILGVNFIVGNDSISIKDNKTETIIPDYMASTSVRSLLYLHFWLKHQAQKGDLLMIDEPELNLHPENQIKMARLFAKLVNVGIKVWITTHSDYIVKELNNLIMLSQSKEKENLLEELKEYGYTKNDFLAPENVSFYTAVEDKNLGGCTVIRSKIGKYGIETPSFDETLDNLLYVSSKIENSLDD
jgi:predicted ATP-dependent endonuclease of OLD family